jgi:1-deoxy-D-xylulose-5-phosphate synthase
MNILPTITGPQDLKGLSLSELKELCGEIRAYLIEVVTDIGGHFASSLGAVELTVALHHLYDSPRDKIVWDVGHQAYVHKILTGRAEQLKTIRRFEGISGFCKRCESEHDAFGAGHASTAISAALGMACARDRNGEHFEVVAVVGDGSMTGGLAFEGLNNAGASGTDITVILNDNKMSISPNVGALSRYLAEVITDPLYTRIKADIWDSLAKIPRLTTTLRTLGRRVDESLKSLITPGMLFEDLGFKYVGPIDGHNLDDLVRILRKTRSLKEPVLLHVLTQKGHGHKDAEANPTKYHGVGPAAKPAPAPTATVKPATKCPTYSEAFGMTMARLASRDKRIVAITAAMAEGTGLAEFRDKFPGQFFDVGIAEGHAVTFAGGLATEGLRPVCAIYSTFLQRAFDHIMHDVALQNLPVVFCLDRAGIAGEDGPTHHGCYDLAFLSILPGMVVAAPKDGDELANMLFTALAYDKGPFAIRFPKGDCIKWSDLKSYTPIPLGKWERLQTGASAAILAVGSMVAPALDAAGRLAGDNISLEVINARFVKPLDTEMLDDIASRHETIFTVEEGSLAGGFGAAVTAQVGRHRGTLPAVHCLGLPDEYIPHGARNLLLDRMGLSASRIEKTVRETLAVAGERHIRRANISLTSAVNRRKHNR